MMGSKRRTQGRNRSKSSCVASKGKTRGRRSSTASKGKRKGSKRTQRGGALWGKNRYKKIEEAKKKAEEAKKKAEEEAKKKAEEEAKKKAEEEAMENHNAMKNLFGKKFGSNWE
jgi:hypothetical protein